MKTTTDPRYPIGRFVATVNPTLADCARWVSEISATPAQVRHAVDGLRPTQWETPYREGGWTVRQVVHHIPDSHMQAYSRMKLALTEDEPTIKPYAEDLWAKLPDVRTVAPETSLILLEALHERWTALLNGLTEPEWHRAFRHPELGLVNLQKAAELYSWHGRHHTAHITELRKTW